MKYKYTGDQDEITLRGVTFKKDKAVELDETDPAQCDLSKKISALPYFERIADKAQRNAENAA